MTKLHKIDREKLAEALQPLPQNRTVHDEIIITDAAENWLAVTDPGFDVPFEWADAAATADMDEKASYADILKAGFEAMIAKAGE